MHAAHELRSGGSTTVPGSQISSGLETGTARTRVATCCARGIVRLNACGVDELFMLSYWLILAFTSYLRRIAIVVTSNSFISFYWLSSYWAVVKLLHCLLSVDNHNSLVACKT